MSISFTLPDSRDDIDINLSNYVLNAPFVIAFICNHCPFVKHLIEQFAAVAKEYQKQGVKFIAINPNDAAAYPEDAQNKMRAFAELHQFSFPYCFDESQHVAMAYETICTPDFYVFDHQQQLRYHGRFDDSRPNGRTPVTGADLMTALNCVLHNKYYPGIQHPSLGCSIKWKNPSP